jgi:hypothetical protein
LVDFIFEKLPIHHPGILDPGLLYRARVLVDNLLGFILPLTELIQDRDIIFLERPINRLPHSGVAPD